MIRLTLDVFQEFQEDFEGYNFSPKELKKFGESMKEKLSTISKALAELEKLGWEWRTTYNNIVLWKQANLKKAKQEIKGLDIDRYILSFESL